MSDLATGWRKAKSGKVHFVTPTGSTSCSERPGPWGVAIGALLSSTWVDPEADDHRCAYCAKANGVVCACGLCRANRRRTTQAKSTDGGSPK